MMDGNDYALGWNAALSMAALMLRSPIVREDASRGEIASHLDDMHIVEIPAGHVKGDAK